MIDVDLECIVPARLGQNYVTLSYVWGAKPKSARLIFNKDTSTRLLSRGSLGPNREDVPQTFRDAIGFVRRLGLKYLWIDALCIQQDDPADLEVQMSNMDQIYGSAVLTLVCDTSDSETGLPGFRPQTREVGQSLYKGEHVSLITTRRSPWSESEASSWSTRGWTLQEDVLSKRLLIFTPRQVFFTCRSATFVEHTVQEASKGPLLPALDVTKGKSTTKDSFFWRRTHQFDGRDDWHDLHDVKPFSPLQEYKALLDAYLQRELTNNSDAINAFAGILKSLTPELGDHHWGLPIQYFTQMLHWEPGPEKFYRNEDFPSWSWAGWLSGEGQSLAFRDLQIDSPMDYLIDFYRFSDEKKKYTLLDDKIRSKRGPAVGNPLLHPPKHRLGWKRSKDKSSTKPIIYAPPVTISLDLETLPISPRGAAPPASHVLRFCAIGVILAVGRTPHYPNSYALTFPGDKSKRERYLGRIILTADWRTHQVDDMEFIVLSRKDANRLTLMLVEKEGDIAYRVGLCDVSITSDAWKKSSPA